VVFYKRYTPSVSLPRYNPFSMETRDVSFYSLMRPNTLSPSGKRRMGKDEASFQKWMITVPRPGS
jgi:hypothetical protein